MTDERINRALAENNETRTFITVCHWAEDADGVWKGTCGIEWSFEYATTPKENKMNYCPNCGACLMQALGGAE